MPKQHNALYGDDLHNPKGMTVDSHASSSKFVISASNMTITASGFTVKAAAFQGDGSGITGVPANDWDGSHTGDGNITGTLTANEFVGGGAGITGITGEWDGSHTGTATFTGNVTASGVVSASGGFVGDGSNLTGVSTGVFSDGTATLISGSSVSTGSFDKLVFDGKELSASYEYVDPGSFISYVGSCYSVGNAVADLPAGVEEGDLVLYCWYHGKSGQLYTQSTTQQEMVYFSSGSYTFLENGNYSGDVNIAALLWGRIQPATVDTVIPSSGKTTGAVAAHIFRGIDTSTYEDVAITEDQWGNNTTPNAPDITTATDNTAIISMMSVLNMYPTHGPSDASSTPDGYSSVIRHDPSGYDTDHGMSYLLDSGDAGAKTVGSWGMTTPGGTLRNISFTVALRREEGGDTVKHFRLADLLNSDPGDNTHAGVSGSAISTGSFGRLEGDGSGITGVTGEWDGSHTGTATFIGNVTASGVVSASGGFVGDGSNLSGISTDSFSDGTATLISGSSVSTGSFAKIHIADAEFLSMDHAAVRGDDDIQFVGWTMTGSAAGMISGLQEDDLILYAYAGQSTATSATQFDSEGYSSLGATNNYDYYYGHVWYKKMGATPDTSIPVPAGNTFYYGDFIATAWRNVHPDDLWDASVQKYNGSNSRPNTPSITTVTAKAVVVSIGMCSGGSFTAGPSGYDGFVSSSASGRPYPGNIGIAYKEIATGASEDPGQFSSEVGNHLGYTIALKKYPAGTYTTNYGFSDIWNQHHKGTYTLVSGSSDSSFSGGTATFNTFVGDGSGLTNLDLSSADGFDYTSGSSPVVTTNPSSVGSTWINTTSGEIFVATDITSDENVWQGTAGNTVLPSPEFLGSRGIFGGGTASDLIEYITISIPGNATFFGDLTFARSSLAACSNGSRGIFGGGWVSAISNIIDYITIATTGNATDFGNLTISRMALAACSSELRGIFGGGESPNRDTIDYITIATTGNAIDFGDLTSVRRFLAGCSNGVRGLFGGGDNSGNVNTIDYVTIASTGNATDFGDLTSARYTLAATSNDTRGLFAGGYTDDKTDTIDYVTIATAGNAADFGDLTVARRYLAGCSDGTYAVFGGSSYYNTNDIMDYVTIASTGNATDFGDLTVARSSLAGCSGT